MFRIDMLWLDMAGFRGVYVSNANPCAHPPHSVPLAVTRCVASSIFSYLHLSLLTPTSSAEGKGRPTLSVQSACSYGSLSWKTHVIFLSLSCGPYDTGLPSVRGTEEANDFRK